MRSILTVLALLLGLPLTVAACLWDSDTPAGEARGMPEVVAVLTGRFERNPPLYYELRLARVSERLRRHPDDLAAYDDAGVACDCLGRGDEAIAWMERKREELDKRDASEPEVKEHRYRYHANLGTFLVHRWARRGADRSKIEEVKTARDEIAKALEINPEAHFGREKYQLRALEWIVDPPRAKGSEVLPNLLGRDFDEIHAKKTDPEEADDAVRGLAGLVVLGNAWESVDIFHALNVALQRDSLNHGRGRKGGRNTLAYLAWLRCRELIDAGKGSMLPDAPKGEELKSMLRSPALVRPDAMPDSLFRKLRADADAWHATRTTFMTRRLKEGRHPDTDSDFWRGYKERPEPFLPTNSSHEFTDALIWAGLILALAIVLGVPLLLVGSIMAFSIAARRAKERRLARRSEEKEMFEIA